MIIRGDMRLRILLDLLTGVVAMTAPFLLDNLVGVVETYFDPKTTKQFDYGEKI